MVEDVDQGKIGLPEIQRPFVWPNVNVRNLFDSLYRGYPAGYLPFWESGAEAATKTIGTTMHGKPPALAIVDGQQRLTSLYAVTKGNEVLRADFRRERIRIAFNPLQRRFDVADASTVKDKSYIPDISVLWAPGANLFELADGFVEDLRKVRDILSEEVKYAKAAIGRLHSLRGLTTGHEYLAGLRQICATTLTNDFWEITLLTSLATSAPRSPSRFAYQAALILIGGRALYSPLKIADMVDPAVKGAKTTFEQHHLFPKGYLKTLNITDTRQVNQIANFAVVEWPDNIKIGDKSPGQYAPRSTPSTRAPNARNCFSGTAFRTHGGNFRSAGPGWDVWYGRPTLGIVKLSD